MNYKDKFRTDAKIVTEQNRPNIDFNNLISFENQTPEKKEIYRENRRLYKGITWGSILATAGVTVAIVLTSPGILDLDQIEPNATISEVVTGVMNSLTALNTIDYPDNRNSQKYVALDYQNGINDFAINSAKSLLNSDVENNVYSPVSFYMSMGMLLHGTSGQAYDELSTLLGVDSLTELQTEMQDLYDNIYNEKKDSNDEITQKSYLSNAAFINETIPVKQDYIDILSQYYYASVFHTDFSNNSKLDIADWANNNTNGLSNLTSEDINVSSETNALIVNSLYFKSLWENAFEVENPSLTEDFLNTSNNTTSQAVYMSKQLSRKLLIEDGYTATSVPLTEGYSMLFVLPDVGTKCSEILNNTTLMNNILNYSTIESGFSDISLKIPRFKTHSRYEMTDYLSDNGITSILAESNNISNAFSVPTSISSIIQEVEIDVKENGIEAGSYNTESYNSDFYPPAAITMELNFDHSFIYILMNSDDIPMFIGTTNSIE